MRSPRTRRWYAAATVLIALVLSAACTPTTTTPPPPPPVTATAPVPTLPAPDLTINGVSVLRVLGGASAVFGRSFLNLVVLHDGDTNYRCTTDGSERAIPPTYDGVVVCDGENAPVVVTTAMQATLNGAPQVAVWWYIGFKLGPYVQASKLSTPAQYSCAGGYLSVLMPGYTSRELTNLINYLQLKYSALYPAAAIGAAAAGGGLRVEECLKVQ